MALTAESSLTQFGYSKPIEFSKLFELNGSGSAMTCYQTAIEKLYQQANAFDRDKEGHLLQTFESRSLDKEVFRRLLRTVFNCKLSSEEVDSILPHVGNGDAIDGGQFIYMFNHFRFDFRMKLLRERLSQEQRTIEQLQRQQKLDDKKYSIKNIELCEFTSENLTSALQILTDAAYKADRFSANASQLKGFDSEYLRYDEFRDQLKRVLGMSLSLPEFSALVALSKKKEDFAQASLDSPDHHKAVDGYVHCGSFLVRFFRLGFKERARREALVREEKYRAEKAREAKRKADLAILEQKNALKCSFDFSPEDKERAMEKLKQAAKLYDKSAPGSVSLQAFEVAYMEPHVFKEQLKRVFNLKMTSPELGALMSIYDEQGYGYISCSYFVKSFLSMGYAEREKDARTYLEKVRKAQEARKAEEARKLDEARNKNTLKVNYSFEPSNFDSAMAKLTEAAFHYDKTVAGTPNLAAFEALEMEPHVFKEQLRRTFNLKISPEELGALMNHFDTKKTGKITCVDFVNKFTKLGLEERDRRRQAWRRIDEKLRIARDREMEAKLSAAEEKLYIKVETFSDEDMASAMSKLTEAAIKYDKNYPSAIKLDAFEADSMPPHVFREQLKLVFGMKINRRELGALMAAFDKENTGEIQCKEFIHQFLTKGFEERQRIRDLWAEEQRRKEQRDRELEQEKLQEVQRKADAEADFNFVEEDFDLALQKLIQICYHFDRRQLGPMGFAAFEAEFFTPSQFREMMKRTFNVKLTPPLLGALVSYFDPSLKGQVNCSIFISSFFQIRIRCEQFKGKTNESELLIAYHAELKKEYKERVQRRIINKHDDETRPWKISSDSHSRPASAKAFRKAARESGGQGYPLTAEEKVQSRIMVAKRTGRLDLSTKALWSGATGASMFSSSYWIPDDSLAGANSALRGSPTALDPGLELAPETANPLADGAVTAGSSVHLPVEGSQATMAIAGEYYSGCHSRIQRIVGDKFDVTRHRALIDPDRHNQSVLSAEKPLVDYKLSALPLEAFALAPKLTELWLCNNSLLTLPVEISDFKNLRILSLNGNGLLRLPPEICFLEHLQKLNLSRNCLSELPELFYRLRQLGELDLSHNLFKTFPSALPSLNKLESLDLACNELSYLPLVPIAQEMKALSVLNIQGNPTLESDSAHLANVQRRLHWVNVITSPPPASPTGSAESVVAERSLWSVGGKGGGSFTEIAGYEVSEREEANIEDLLRRRAVKSNAAKAKANAKRKKKAATTPRAAANV